MPLSITGDGGVYKGGGVLCKCGVHKGSNPSFFGETFLWARRFYYECGYFITRADTDMTECYLKRLY